MVAPESTHAVAVATHTVMVWRLARSTTANTSARADRRTPFQRPHTTAACTWEASFTVTMQIGFTVVLVKKLEFLLVETSMLVKLMEPGVKISSLGMCSVRHWMKPLEVAKQDG
nr:unnamed protein product [Digitaria exilis]